MTKMTLSAMMQSLNDLTADELLSLNKQLGIVYKAKRSATAVQAVVTGKFQVGDVIKFWKSGRGRNSGWNYFKFDHLNRNRDCMQGPSCSSDGTPHFPTTKWTVALTSDAIVVFRNGKPFTE